MHGSQIAVCHLTDIDPTITCNLDDNEDARCQVCQKANRPASILLCDDCNQGYHLSCLQPKLTRVPKEEFWYCPKCVGQLPDTDLTPEYLHACENRGKQLDGRRMLKVINGQPYEGTLTWLGIGERPFALKCKYDDGDEETFTLAELQQYLLPDDATVPQKQAVAQAQVTRHTVESAALAAITHGSAANTCPSTPYSDRVWDPYAGTKSMEAALTGNGITVHSSDLNPQMDLGAPLDALQPGNVSRMRSYNVVVTSPSFRLLDLALPLLAANRELLCAHVPLHYVFDAHPARRQWLGSLAQAQRLSILLCEQKGPLGRRNIWLIITDSSSTLSKRTRTTSASCIMNF
ncbi:hypothetical protein CYMTET_35819 [Cymbomonas tetramitiformis]|uniref:PHD-type domain-containing protein n=1 Tax=Cymbomonas tetramitiformis TaxID=36881 RepID=A0AAE0F8F7_9CHLO|nr:hypothetical protein CYMTET_35819 [Cymbomonas tetramitiformis]